MILSSDELQIIEYLKSWGGKPVTMIEICRCAAGRKKFREAPNWAKSLMARLVDSQTVAVNERGHYCWIAPNGSPAAEQPEAKPAYSVPSIKTAVIVGDDYFPAPEPQESSRWVSPQIAEILKKSGKQFGGPQNK